ncbi:ribonuclease Z [Microvirga mediterraneensis]|uniref:Ribonuclease Z n=1 Tax=Microvirga mediterraneensis TaxID=2754695 RepID=A0A838BRN2_9HYPH|nr:ribonuclease Z [Microvirga mediterraneensis]MBA1157655.1 ribonuclease Z [Microvirga mediterraneensis]
MSWLVQPRLVNDPFSDPGLYLDFRYGRRAILFDLGDVSALSSRELLRVSHVFVSHTHVDHMAGFDRLFRLCLHRPLPLTLIGPPGFAAQIEHRIRGFTWNLLDENSVDFCLRAMDYDGTGLMRAAEFHAREAFARREIAPPAFPHGVAWMEDEFRIDAVALAHGIPSLAFALREVLQVNVWRGVLDDLNLPPGPWLNEAKRAVRLGLPGDHLIAVPGGQHISLGDLKGRALRVAPGQVVAYVTDAAPHAENRAKILQLAHQADQLFIEAVFLECDRALAVASLHLTAHEAGSIAREAGVKHVTPFHHSARYLSEPDALRDELFESFRAEGRAVTNA